MTTFVFANNVNTTLSAPISATATSITLTSSANLPTSIPSGDYFALTLNDAATRSVFEIVYATAISGSTLTVVRGQEGTTASTWLSGDYAFSGPTAGQMQSFNVSSGVQSVVAGTNITVNNTDPRNPVVSATGSAGGVLGIVAGTNVTVNNSNPSYPVVSATGGGSAGVSSFNTRTGAVTLSGTDVDTALGYTAANDASVVHIAGSETITGAKAFNAGLTATTGTFSGALTCSTMNATSSDRRLKTNIAKVDPRPLHRGIPLVSYTMKASGWSGIGAIAQTVKKVASEYVGEFEQDGKKYLSLNYAGIAHETSQWAAREVDRLRLDVEKLKRELAKAKIKPHEPGFLKRLLEKVW